MRAVFFKLLKDYEFSVRASNALERAGFVYVGEVVQKTANELLKTNGIGRKTLVEIREMLEKEGLRFGEKITDQEKLELSLVRSGQTPKKKEYKVITTEGGSFVILCAIEKESKVVIVVEPMK